MCPDHNVKPPPISGIIGGLLTGSGTSYAEVGYVIEGAGAAVLPARTIVVLTPCGTIFSLKESGDCSSISATRPSCYSLRAGLVPVFAPILLFESRAHCMG